MKRLPVTKLNYSLLEKGVYVAKHGDGIEIASGEIDLARLSLSEPIVKEGSDKVKKVKAWIEDGLKIFAQYSRNDLIRVIEKPQRLVKLKFLSGHDHVIDLSDEDALWGESIQYVIRVDAEISFPKAWHYYMLWDSHTSCAISPARTRNSRWTIASLSMRTSPFLIGIS